MEAGRGADNHIFLKNGSVIFHWCDLTGKIGLRSFNKLVFSREAVACAKRPFEVMVEQKSIK
jgi:hypothetical protein